MDLSAHLATVHRLARIDPDPRVRHRADALVLVATGPSLTEAARLLGRSRSSVRSWRDRFLAAGRAGLADRGRRSRPPKLDEAVWGLLGAEPTDEAFARAAATALADAEPLTPTAYKVPLTRTLVRRALTGCRDAPTG